MPLPFALDHINLWLLAERDGWTVVDCGYGDATTRALWETHFAQTLRGRPITRIIATHFHPDHLGNARWLMERFGCPVVMTQAEFLTAHAVLEQRAAHSHTRHLRAVRARTAWRPDSWRPWSPAATPTAAACRSVPDRFDGMLDGDDVVAGGSPWRDHLRSRALPGARVAALRGARTAHFRRHAAAAHQHQRERRARRTGRRSAGAVPRLRSRRPRRCRRRRWCCRRTVCRFAGIALRVAQLQTHHADRLAELADAVAAAAAPVSAADLLPVLFRRELDLQQRYFAMGEAIAHLNHLWHRDRIRRTVAADGAIRFTT